MTDDSLPFAKRLPPATFWAALAGGFFFLVYGLCNNHAAARAAAGEIIPTIFFEWERFIPIWPAFIVPYWSLDLFFAFSFLLLRTRREMRRHALRLITAITIAGLFFWFVPLRYGFDRPQLGGIFGPLFKTLHSFDQPYNLAPSLHIALRSLMWVVYIPATRGWTRAALKVWFIAIGVSTLVVGQHHVIDVLTGQLLAMLVLQLIPDDEPDAIPSGRSPRLGLLYAVGGVACTFAGVALGKIGLLFAWPFLSLALAAGAYLGGNPYVYRKHHGRIPTSARWLLGPVIFSKWLHWRLTRSPSAYDNVTPTLLVGRRLTITEAEQLADNGITTVIDLTAESSAQPKMLQHDYVNVPVLDLVPPSVEQLRVITAHYLEARQRGPVLVHCRLGFGRSACGAAACLLASKEADTVDQAIEMIRAARPGVVFRSHHRDVLERFRRERHP